MLRSKSKPSVTITQLLTSIDTEEGQARALLPYSSREEEKRERRESRVSTARKRKKSRRKRRKSRKLSVAATENTANQATPRDRASANQATPRDRASRIPALLLRRDKSLSFGPIPPTATLENQQQGRPTLTERELSRTIAWRRKQVLGEKVISTSSGIGNRSINSQVVTPQILVPSSSSARGYGDIIKDRSETSETPETFVSIPTSTTMAMSSAEGGGKMTREKSARDKRERKLRIDFASSVSLGVTNEPPLKSGADTDYLPQPSSVFDVRQDRRSTMAESTQATNNKRSVYLKVRKPLTNDKTMINALTQGSDIFDTVEIPVIRKWIGPSDLHYAFLKCIPLAAACLILSLLFFAWGLTNIVMTCAQGGITWDETGDIVVGIFKILIGVSGIVTVAFKLKMGLHFLCVGYNVFLVSQTVSFITQWLEWGLALGGATTVDHIPWRPEQSEKLYMVWTVLQLVLMITISFLFIIGTLASMKMVVAVGGTGWEKKTYLEILEQQELKRQANYDLEMGCSTQSTDEGSHSLEAANAKRGEAAYTPDLTLT